MNTLLKEEKILELTNNHFSLEKLESCSLIRRGFNDHYQIVSENARYVFRVYLNHKYYIGSSDAFQFELDLLEHLYNDGIPVANAIRLENRELLGWVSTDCGDRAFALFPHAPGNEVRRGSISTCQSYQLGKAMAGLHLSANNFYSEHKRYHLDLRYLVEEPLRLISEKIGEKESKSISDEDKEELQGIIESLGSIESLVNSVRNICNDQDEYGIIHGDLHTGNVHFQGNELVVFDFDHCAYGWRAYDISICLFLPDDQRDSMLNGYESLRPLSEEERDCLPIFFKLRRLWDIGDMLATESIRSEPI